MKSVDTNTSIEEVKIRGQNMEKLNCNDMQSGLSSAWGGFWNRFGPAA